MFASERKAERLKIPHLPAARAVCGVWPGGGGGAQGSQATGE